VIAATSKVITPRATAVSCQQRRTAVKITEEGNANEAQKDLDVSLSREDLQCAQLRNCYKYLHTFVQ